MDTNALSDIFNELLNDRCFIKVTGVPNIKTNADGKEFLKKYMEYCRQIEINRLGKIRDMLESLGFDAKNCAQAIAQRIKEMTEACQADLSDDEKDILCHDSHTNGYAKRHQRAKEMVFISDCFCFGAACLFSERY